MMAARVSAAASLALSENLRYCNAKLLSLKKVAASLSLAPKLKSELGRLRILRTTARKYGSHSCGGKRKWRARRQKRAGLIAKMKAGARRPTIISLYLSNATASGPGGIEELLCYGAGGNVAKG